MFRVALSLLVVFLVLIVVWLLFEAGSVHYGAPDQVAAGQYQWHVQWQLEWEMVTCAVESCSGCACRVRVCDLGSR